MYTDTPKYRAYLAGRIMRKATAHGNCLLYGSAELKHAYGLVSVTIDGKRKSVPAHRALYMALNDVLSLPSQTLIRHKCDNPRCVNIDHLEPGSAKDNVQDCIVRNRRAKRYKGHTRQRVHGPATVQAIRAATGKIAWIAAEFGVSSGYVSKLRSGKLKASHG